MTVGWQVATEVFAIDLFLLSPYESFFNFMGKNRSVSGATTARALRFPFVGAIVG